MEISEVIHSIIAPRFTGGLLLFKIVILIFSFLFLVAVILLILKTSWWRKIIWQDLYEFFTFKSYEVKKLREVWEKIVKKLETEIESESKLAIIEADEMLEKVLKEMGFKGESSGERINQLTSDLVSNLDSLKEAHRVRNNIIHDQNFRLSLAEAKKLLEIYQKTLKDLEVI